MSLPSIRRSVDREVERKSFSVHSWAAMTLELITIKKISVLTLPEGRVLLRVARKSFRLRD